MNIIRVLMTKKYRTRIFLWMTSVMVTAIILLSSVIYMNAEKSVLNSEYESSQKILNQMKFNIDFMDNMVKNLCFSTYYSREVQSLMNFTGEETFDQIDIMGKLSSSVSSNPYVQSIYVYNNRKKVFYSTYSSFKYEDEDLKKLIKEYKVVPVLRPIIRKAETYNVGNVKQYKDVITYFMYEITDQKNNMNGAVVLNIKLDWLIENMNQINMFDGEKHDKIYVLDSNGNFLPTRDESKSEADKHFEKELSESYAEKQRDGLQKNADLYRCRINNKDYLVSYFKINEANWVLFNTQPYDVVFDYVNKLKIMIITITAIALILIAIAAFTISTRLYRPLEGLLKQLNYSNSFDSDHKGKGDEFVFLQDIYKSSLERIEEFRAEKLSNEKIIRMYFMRKLIFSSFSMTPPEFEKNKTELSINLDMEKCFAVIVLRIDNLKEFQEINDERSKDLLKFAIMNITSEIISKSFNNEVVEMKDDEIVVILNSGSDDFSDEINNILPSLLNEAQSLVKYYYHITFTAAVSEKCQNIKELSVRYNQAVNYSKYRFIFGKMSVITPLTLKRNLSPDRTSYNFDEYKSFIEKLQQGDIRALDKSLDNIIKELRNLEYNDMMLSLAYIVNITMTTIYMLNETRKEPIIVNSLLADNAILELETIDEFKDMLLEVLSQIDAKNNTVLNSKDQKTAETIKIIIDENYFDYNLSAAGLASQLKLSPTKIGKIFKEYMGTVSIPEYINSVRLTKAVEWMENSKLSIGEIMLKVGIENESYFYKIFKAKYGTTPREYISNRTNRHKTI